MLEKRTVMGGSHGGWKVAGASMWNSALPFCTGTSAAAAKSALLTALGWLPPPLMHSAVAVTTTWICSSSPRPASLPSTIRVLPDWLMVTLCTGCGLPAHAVGTASPTPLSVSTSSRLEFRPYAGAHRQACRRERDVFGRRGGGRGGKKTTRG